MKTLAQLKRDALSGRLSLEMVEHFGKTGNGIPERLRGIRKVIGANTVCIKLLNQDGQESELDLKYAKLVAYTDDTLTIYAPNQRDPDEQEQKVLEEAERIAKEYEAENPYSDAFWRVKEFFRQSACPWMAGNEMLRGKKYQSWTGKVIDSSQRGDVILRYKVYMD